MAQISLIFTDAKIVDQALDGSDIVIADSVDIVDVSSLDIQDILIVNDGPGDKGSIEIGLADGSVHTLVYNLYLESDEFSGGSDIGFSLILPGDFPQESAISYLDPATDTFIPYDAPEQSLFISAIRENADELGLPNDDQDDLSNFVNSPTEVSLQTDPSVAEGGIITYNATLTRTANTDVRISLGNGETILISVGETRGSVSIDAPADDLYPDAETVTNYISAVRGGNLENTLVVNGIDNPVTTIVTDTIDSVFAVLSGTAAVVEGGSAEYTLSLIDIHGQSVSVSNDTDVVITLASGSAENNDYSSANQTLTILSGESSATFTLATVIDPDLDAETFTATVLSVEDTGEFESIDISSGADGQTSSQTTTILDVSEAPVFTSATTTSVAENQIAAYTATATDADGTSLSFSLSGTDASLFSIDSATGVVTFNRAPDFESPADDASDNTYNIIVTASDGTNSTDQAVAITVVNENDNAPVFNSISSANVLENQTSAYTAEATDPDGEIPTYSLGGADAALFSIDANTGAVAFNVAPDFENPADVGGDNIYNITVTASDGTNTTDQSLIINVLNGNDGAPVFSSSSSATVQENQSAAYTALATDPDGDVPGYSLNGADGSLFSIDTTTGVVTFNTAPDFESPLDSDGDNTYNIIVTASDGLNSTDHTVAITLSDLNDVAPLFTSGATTTVIENQVTAYTAVITDPDGSSPSFTLSGTDAALFSIDSNTGELTFNSAPDFENPSDIDSDNIYNIIVTASDGLNSTDQAVAIRVTNANDLAPVFTSATTAAAAENQTGVIYTAVAIDADGDRLTYSLGGTDAGLFDIDSDTGELTFISAPDFELPGDDNGDNVYDITITASDGVNSVDQSVAITLRDELDAIELSDVELGNGGFVINGVSATDFSGASVSSAGDVNGDGLDDLIIGAFGDDPNRSNSGASFVVFGKTDGAAVELSDVEAGTGGFVINGVSFGDFSGVSVSSAGDLNGDGLDDLIIGAHRDDPNGRNSGSSFVVFGKTDGAVIELSDVEAGTGGFVINGFGNYVNSGASVSSAGDVNGDGLDDLVVGAPYDDPNGDASGASFVVFGKTDGSTIELSDVELGNGGFVVNGVSIDDYSGYSVSGAGDVNGDGLDDLIVAATYDDPNGDYSGASFVVFGKTDGSAIELSDVELGTGGFVINGVSADDYSGFSVSSAGDVNGDGLDDLIIGSPYDDPNGNSSGASFVVFGKTDGAAVELSAVENGNDAGFVINGVSANDYSGLSVSSAGDVNADGLDDVIVGAYRDEPNGIWSGASFVVYGKTDGTAVELSDVELGTGGFVINGVSAGGSSGVSVSRAGDVNGDGFDDLIVGAYRDDPNGSFSGASFVVFGGQSSSATVGTPGADTLTGDGNANQLVAGMGDDLLIGNGGADVLRGGEGDDVLAISDTNFANLDGGNGTDTLRVDSLLNLDLTRIANNRLDGLEVIDLNDTGSTLTLNTDDVLTIVGSEAANDLRIDGTSSDRVDFNLDGFAHRGATETINTITYDIYTNNNVDASVRVLVQQGVIVEGTVFSGIIELSDVEQNTDTQGFVINGVSAYGYTGYSVVSSAGDINGDGLDDLIVGAWSGDPNGFGSGASVVVFGQTDGTVIELSDVESGAGGFVINGVSADDLSGRSVSSAGDVNGDGLDDLIIGALFDDPNDTNSGASFVVFGKTDGSAVELSDVETGTGGFVINGVSAFDNSGTSVSGAGDVNGDGLEDLIVGADSDDPNGNGSGTSFVVFGKTDGTLIELSDVESGIGGFVINGASIFDNSGYSVSGAGDVNGDGLDDLIIGALFDDPNDTNSGASFVVFGKTGSTVVELSDVETGLGGFVINGVNADDRSGFSVSNAGDVNGDGLDDLIVGAYEDDPNGSDSGASFVVFGKTDGAAVELSDVETGTGAGFVINGVSADDLSGRSVSSAGDVNGDGLDDLIVGALCDGPNGDNSGASFVVFGKTDSTVVELSDVEVGSGGFVINGVNASDYSGFTVSGAGDVNGDGFDDLIVGAPNDAPNGDNSGASFVIFGGQGSSATVGTLGADTLTGDMSANQLVAGMGDDLLIGNGGADVLRGGAGDDVLAISDTNFASLDGGNGTDTLRLDSLLNLDLTRIANNRLDCLEVIDLNDTGSTLTLNTDDVLTIVGSEAANDLRINGSNSDNLVFNQSGYAQQGVQIIGTTTYDIYLNHSLDSSVRVLVEQGISVSGNSLVIELSDVELGNNTQGFVINGVSASDRSGVSVSSAGDVNGDGLDDLIVGAYRDDPNNSNSGASFVVFGKTDGAAVELSAVETGIGGFVINGVSAGDRSGFSVSSAGDVNGDGLDDLIVGAPYDDPNSNSGNSGGSFVVFGKTDGIAVELSDVETGTDAGFVINGVSGGDQSGFSVSSAGDVNGDGLDDLIVGAPYDDPNSNSGNSGGSFVVFGKTDGTAIELSDVESGTGGFVINGVSGSDQSGGSVSSAGDVNGDGLDDLIVGARLDDPNGSASGASFVVFGKTDGTAIDLSDVESGTGGFVINGVGDFDQSGGSVSSAGDVNGDGLDDLIVGARYDSPNGSYSGASFVVFGKTDGTVMELSDVEAGADNSGFVINGVGGVDQSGFSVSSAGDVNGDGLDDLIVGARFDDPNGNSSGAGFVVFGKTDGTAVELSDVEAGTGGFVINGVSERDQSGFSVSGAGDVNGDGFDELIVGARFDAPNGDNSGASFVIFGGQGSSATVGTSGADTLIGDMSANQLVAGQGDDVLLGNGGADVLRGGAGEDVLAISDTSFARIDGGNGTDTLRFDAAISLDFTALSDNRIENIEAIDLTNDGGDSSLTLNLTDVLQLSESSNTLSVDGDGGDILSLINSSNGQAGTWALSVDGAGTDTYDFSSGADVLASVLVDDSLRVNLI